MKNHYSDDENDDDNSSNVDHQESPARLKRGAADEDEEEFVDSSEEDDNDAENEYQFDDFVVAGDGDKGSDNDKSDDGSEDGSGDDDGKTVAEREADAKRREDRKKRREERRKRREEKRSKKADERTRLHRLKKIKVDDEDLKEKLSYKLFGEDDILGDDDEEQNNKDSGDDYDNYDESEDELDDFVVDSHNKPVRKKNRSSGRRQTGAYKDIFGGEVMDVEEEKPRDSLSIIKEQYEPSLLEEKHFTDADEEIRRKNVPERMQTRKGTQYDSERTYDEAEWIYDAAFDTKEGGRDSKSVEIITALLRFFQRDMLEVPFVYTYKKDVFEPNFTLADLWTIYDLDEKWCHLITSKRNLEAVITANPNLERYRTTLVECKLEEGVSDLYDLFQMVNGADANAAQAAVPARSILDDDDDVANKPAPKLKRAIRRDLYTVFSKAGLTKYLNYFGMSAQEFGVNLMDNYMTNMPIDHTEDPSTTALRHICVEAGNVDEVSRATRYLMAHDIGFDPNVRQSIRIIYRKYAYITTTPTPMGYKEIDVFHPYITIKSIREKPCHLFDDTQYLLILKAEKEGFVKITIGIPEKVHEDVILPEMQSLYLSDGTSSTSQQWNEERRQILRESLTKFLYPSFEKELRSKMLTDASNRVAFECAQRLEEKLRVAPWHPKTEDGGNNDDDEDFEDDDGNYYRRKKLFNIMTLCWGSGKVPTMAAIINSECEVVTHAKLDFLCDRVGESTVKGKKDDDITKLQEILEARQPRLILISATEMDSRKLFEEVNIAIHFANPEIGLSLQNSAKYTDEFKEYPSVLRHAIAIGRCALDPLTEYSNLCTDNNEVLYLKLHPLQEMIGKDYLLKLLHRCFINVVNAVGVDINRFIQHKFTSAPLQFVAGLGSRKAQALLTSIFRRGGYITSRASIDKLLNQDIVYRNCIGFIQIREKYFDNERYFNPLDDTRVHPEDYVSAYKIAADALDKRVDNDTDEAKAQGYVADVMRKPKKLESIDLDAFADVLESRQNTKKKKLLYAIKTELTSPFADIRFFFNEPSMDMIFSWLTGETDQTLRIGTLVSVTSFRNSEEGVKVRLENGLEGTIPQDSLSDNNDIKSLPRATTLNCRVTGIFKEAFSVNLSCKQSDLDNSHWEEKIFYELKDNGANPYLVLGEAPKPVERKKVSAAVRREKRVKRVVIHPLWHSFTCAEAEAYLQDKPIGEAILRPSSKGMDHITVTFKFWDTIILHHDIKEGDKPNAVSLGKSFYLGDAKYDSLDEILARHVEYLINNLNEVRNHRYWRSGTRTQIDEAIRRDKQKNPKTIPYQFGIDIEYPGFVILFHVPSDTPRHEHIKIRSDGFEVRRKCHATLEDLIKYFKQNYAQFCQSNRAAPSVPSSSVVSNVRLPSNTPAPSSQMSSHIVQPGGGSMSSNKPSYSSSAPSNYQPPTQSQQPYAAGGYTPQQGGYQDSYRTPSQYQQMPQASPYGQPPQMPLGQQGYPLPPNNRAMTPGGQQHGYPPQAPPQADNQWD
eukprot:gene8015-9416_t